MPMPPNFQPMLASRESPWDECARIFDEGGIILASRKLDGIRCSILDSALSRTLKPIRNLFISTQLANSQYEGLDGELIVGAPYGEGVMSRAQSGVMSYSGEPDFSFWIFDHIHMGAAGLLFKTRYETLELMRDGYTHTSEGRIKIVEQFEVTSLKQLEEREQQFVDEGYEGAILRLPSSPYKFGRATLRERFMMKLKRFLDSEAIIIGFQEKMINANEPTQDARGYQVRSSHKDGKIPANTLGALLVRDLHNSSWEFTVGSGFDDSLRAEIWSRQDEWINMTIKYKYLPVGTKDLPRHPIYLGRRDSIDIS